MPETSKTTDQALAVLLELGENGPMTPAALARALGMNRTVVHRLLATLHARGFVTRQENGYVPGAVLLRLAERVQPELRAVARMILADLARETGETVVMHVSDGDDAVVLDQVVSQAHVVRVEHRVGSRHRLDQGASGRAMLAFLPESAVKRIVARSGSPVALRHELDAIGTLGYGTSHDELQDGVHGVAAPVLDPGGHALASVGVLVPASRASGLAGHLDALLDASQRISRAMAGDIGAPPATLSA